MKKVLFAAIFVAAISFLNAQECSEEQIGKMIKQNLSQATIDTLCAKSAKETNTTTTSADKQVVVNIVNAPVNNNNNINTNTNGTNLSSDAQSAGVDNREYFFWRLGLGRMDIGDLDFAQMSLNAGLQYFAYGLKEDGFGIGCSFSTASKNENPDKFYETTSEIELMYNFVLQNGFAITPAFIFGNITETVESTNYAYSNFNYTSSSSNTYGIKGFGLYLNFPGIVKSGQGLSLFAKKLSVEDSDLDLTLFGAQIAW